MLWYEMELPRPDDLAAVAKELNGAAAADGGLAVTDPNGLTIRFVTR